MTNTKTGKAKPEKKKTSAATKKPKKNALTVADRATAIYGILADYEKAMHRKSVATKTNESLFLSNYESIEKSLTGAEQSLIKSMAKRKPSGNALFKHERKTLNAIKTAFKTMLESPDKDISELEPESGSVNESSESGKYLCDWLKKHVCADKIISLKGDEVDMYELCESRAEMIINALPEDFRPAYGRGARFHALYEICYKACIQSGIGNPRKAKKDIEFIYQSIVDYGNTSINTGGRKRTAHFLDMMDRFLFCFLVVLPLKELKAILPMTGKRSNSEHAKKLRYDAIVSIYVTKESFAKRFYHPSHMNVTTATYSGGKKSYERMPGDFGSLPWLKDFLKERGIKNLLVTGNSISIRNQKPQPENAIDAETETTPAPEAFSDADRALVNTLLERKNIASAQKEAINKALRLMDEYREKYENLRRTLVKAIEENA